MSKPFTTQDLEVWRYIRDQGGYWLAGELLSKFPTLGNAHRAGGILTRLYNAGHLKRNMRWDGTHYGITSACEAPPGESLDPVEKKHQPDAIAEHVINLTPDGEEQSLNGLVNQLVVIAEKAPTHRLMLLALLSTYKAIAITHPCCTNAAAKTALRVGSDLLTRSLGTQPSNTTH